MNKSLLILLLAVLTVANCQFINLHQNRGLSKRQFVATTSFPTFKVTNCPDASTVIAKFSGGPTCPLSLPTTSDLKITGKCIPNSITDRDLPTPGFIVTIESVVDSTTNAAYAGDFFLKYNYGNLIVIGEVGGTTVGTSSNVYFPVYTCALAYCDSSKYYTACVTKKSPVDFSHGSDFLIISSNPTVDFCKAGGSSCCAGTPASCPGIPNTVTYGPASTVPNTIRLKETSKSNIVAVAQPFTLPTDSSELSSVTFRLRAFAGGPITYDLLIYEWNTATKVVVGSFLFKKSAQATSTATDITTQIVPPLPLNSAKTYAAVLSLQDYGYLTNTQLGVFLVNQSPSTFTFGYKIDYGNALTVAGSWSAVPSGSGSGSFYFVAKFNTVSP